MIAINVGKKFLEYYNRKKERNFSAKEFFDKEYFELFFNHEKYMQWPGNSPFVQGLSSSKMGRYGVKETIKDKEGKTLKFESDKKLTEFFDENISNNEDILEVKSKSRKGISVLKYLSVNERQKKLEAFHFKVNDVYKNGNIDSSIALGFPASEEKEFATTSGQVVIDKLKMSKEDIYLSWIGSSLSLGVSGGFSILFNEKEILYKTFEGWKVYRKFLNQESLQHLAPNKIISWNGQWLNFVFSKNYRENYDYNKLDSLGFFHTKNNITVINTVKWSQLFFNISRKLPNEKSLAYIYSLGQMNKTLGFFPFKFNQANKIIEYYKILFGENAALKDSKSFEQLFGIHIKRACELGAFGLQTLRPEGLIDYFDPNKIPNFKKVKPSIKNNDSEDDKSKKVEEANQKDYHKNIIPFRTYKTWLTAMISKNKEDMIDYTDGIAKAFHRCRTENKKKGGTKVSNQINELLTASSKVKFIQALTDFISNEDIPSQFLEQFLELKNRVHLMPTDEFKYLITLIKFDYQFQNRTL